MGDMSELDKGIDINPTNLELIRLAKELAYSEYNNKKAELHNQWLKESDIAWRLHKAKVTYPNIPPFPTEAEIIDRAHKLISFLNTPRPDLQPQVEEPVKEPSEEQVEDKPETTEENTQPVQEQPQEKTPEKKPNSPLDNLSNLDIARLKVAKKIDSNNTILDRITNLTRNAWK